MRGGPGPSTPEPSGIQPTTRRDLLMAGLAGGVAGWAVVKVAQAMDATPPLIPWVAPLALVLAAGFVGYLAYLTNQQVHVQRVRIEVNRAVAMLVLGKSAALAGVAVAVGYFGFALNFLPRVDVAAPRERVVRSVVAILGGALLCIAGLLLERACRISDDDDAEDETDGFEAP